MGDVVFIRDYERTKRLEREAKEILGEVLPLVEFAKTGGPIIGASDFDILAGAKPIYPGKPILSRWDR